MNRFARKMIQTKRYQIFGVPIEVNTIDTREGHLLQKELTIYPKSAKGENCIEINYVESIDESSIICQNPSINSLTPDGFIYTMGPTKIRFYISKRKVNRVDFSIKKASFFKAWLVKAVNIQFTNHQEAIGQWFHEYILIPLAFTFNSTSILHSSAVETKEGNVLLFGGTGGVGKTSLEIELCRTMGCSFVADDIAVVTEKGVVFPNLSYPKVYGYNMKGESKIRKEIFNGMGVANKFFFWLHSLRGNQFVRRRMNPANFYGTFAKEPKSIGAFLILVRNEVDTIEFEEISPERASNLNSLVISREYGEFFNHLVWQEFNSLVSGVEASLNYELIIGQTKSVLVKALQGCQTFLVHIPLNLDHANFKKQMTEALASRKLI